MTQSPPPSADGNGPVDMETESTAVTAAPTTAAALSPTPMMDVVVPASAAVAATAAAPTATTATTATTTSSTTAPVSTSPLPRSASPTRAGGSSPTAGSATSAAARSAGTPGATVTTGSSTAAASVASTAAAASGSASTSTTGGAATSTTGNATSVPTESGYQPSLNVQDALSYLDKVKIQFSEQPEVYNMFLDIMKDFKSHCLDTPGVIDRVSSLFRGFPSLIVGFNTFLPAGYKIEVTNDALGQSYTITTPHSVHQQRHALGPPPTVATLQAQQQAAIVAQQQATNVGAQQKQQQQHVGMTASAQASGSSSFGAAPAIGAPVQAASNIAKKPPIEFNHAINYVNKIKNRYSGDPETYKQFLEILRTYQNESKPIQEVYAQVQVLFRGAPDLLDEFKQFLPDPNANNANASLAPAGVGSMPVQSMPIAMAPSGVAGRKGTAMVGGVPPAMAYRPGPHVYQQAAVVSTDASKYKRMAPGSFPVGAKRARYEAVRYGGRPQSQYGAAEEFDFFERVKKTLGNKTTYTEFLKVLNLFNQDIIDPKTLVDKVEPFLARSPELFDWFKAYVRVDDAEDVPSDIVKSSMPPRDLSGAKRSGSSYRLLPKDYVQAPCSGRDALFYEVLNDKWVCHPTWASEDGGFVAHKKNVYEDSMYRCEEERYEFDLNIEANKITIQRLEPIAKRIAAMTPEEARAFKLPDGLGDGMSKLVYKRVIKKIYDKERGQEVIESLHEHPAVALPIVLKRMKQKDEEWRRNQREWNKIWRELDSKNYYKSLDHQGLNFKAIDKKNISSKGLVAEIEALYKERAEKEASPAAGLKPGYHVRYQFAADRSILVDVKKVVASYLDKSAQYSAQDQALVEKFLESFLDAMFPAAHAGASSAGGVDDMAVDGETTTSTRSAILTMFGNTNFYVFYRLFCLACDRLGKMKQASAHIDKIQTGYSRQKSQDVASALDLVTKRDLPVEVVDGDVYAALHTLIDKLFDGEVDINVFEEQTRFWFGTSAYILYTIDKLVHNLAKHVIILATDPRCIKLYQLFARESDPSPALKLGAAYCQKADEQLEDEENLYKIDYDPVAAVLAIELLGESELHHRQQGDDAQAEARWSDYIDNYVKSSTASAAYEPKKPVFLKRNLPREQPVRDKKRMFVRNNLECKICVNTYKLFFVENSEDVFLHRRPHKSAEKTTLQQSAAREKWHRWLNLNWCEGLSSDAKKTALAQWDAARK